MSARARALLLATVSLSALSSLAHAQDDLVLDTISVTATKTEGRIVDTLGGVSTVSRSEIERLQSSRISDVLRNVPGVAVQENANDPAQAINIRGLQDFGRVNVLVDGARQNFQTTGHNANGVFYLDPELIGGVDIVRGPVSTIYGSGAIGGVVAFRTRTIDDILNPEERYGVTQKVGFGTNGAGWLSTTSAGARIGEAADLYGQLVYRNTNNYRDGSDRKIFDTGNELKSGLFKVNVRPAEGHSFSGSMLLQDFDFSNNGSSGAGSRFQHDVAANTYTLGYRFQRPDVPLLDLSVRGYVSTTTDEQRSLAPSATYQRLGVRPGDRLRYDIETYGIDISNTSRFSGLGLDHALTVGADAVRDEVTTSDQAGGFGAAFTPSGQRSLAGAFIQDEIRFGSWLRVIGALRFDDYSLEGGTAESSGSHLSPKVTIGVTPVRGIELYGTYAEGYRAPSISETLVNGIHPYPSFRILPNPNLRPETAHNFEAGVNVAYDDVLLSGDKFRAKAAAFVNNVDDYIDQVALPGTLPFRPPGYPVFLPPIFLDDYQYRNIAKARLSGVEFEANYDWGRGFVTLAASHVTGKNTTDDTPLASVSPDRVSSTLGLRFLGDALTIGTRVTLVDSSRRNVPSPSKAYGLVDVFASYAVSERVKADVVVQNLFDKRYVPYLNSDASPGLTAKFALTVKFAQP